MIKVFKFGGASIKNAAGVKRLAEILTSAKGEVIVVISAMGKTTNALEKLVPKINNGEFEHIEHLLCEIEEYHLAIAKELKIPDLEPLQRDFKELRRLVKNHSFKDYDKRYDCIVSMGELMSSRIVSEYLNSKGISNQWVDARNVIITDDNHRDARVDFKKTGQQVKSLILKVFKKKRIALTQGFIGANIGKNKKKGQNNSTYTPTTLGREGSDYTAAILAYCTNAESVTIWKDVPGVLNADPRKFKDTIKIDHLNYQDAIELAYYGATVIHPKTIKPLQNKNIPLYVKSFANPSADGTCIDGNASRLPVPSFISKADQVLLSLSPKDFSFIAEENLSLIFDFFSKHKVKVNMIQHSAINFSVCFDNDPRKIPALLNSFSKNYRVLYNENVELFTIRYYNQLTIDKITQKRKVLLEQRSRYTIQLVIKN